jgi:hypothetical protein
MTTGGKSVAMSRNVFAAAALFPELRSQKMQHVTLRNLEPC